MDAVINHHSTCSSFKQLRADKNGTDFLKES